MRSTRQGMPGGDLIRLNSGRPCQVRAGYLIDGSGGPIRENVVIGIEQGRIVTVESGPMAGSASLESADLSACTILPALMDAHVHLALSGTRHKTDRQNHRHGSALDARNVIARHCRDHLANGVVSVRDAGDRHGAVLAARTKGRLPICVAATCWAWHAPGRYGRMIGNAPEGHADLERAVIEAPDLLDHIKIINSGINSIDDYGHYGGPQFSDVQLARVGRWARRQRLPLMVHANGPRAVGTAVAAGCDSIEHGYFMGEENLRRMADGGTYWVPTLAPMAALAASGAVTPGQARVARRTLSHQMGQVVRAVEMGVRIALGTDAGSMGVDHGAAVRRELSLLIEAGMRLETAIRCATLNAARLMGLRRRGAVRPGWSADLVAVKCRPHQLPDHLNRLHGICCNGRWLAPEDLSAGQDRGCGGRPVPGSGNRP